MKKGEKVEWNWGKGKAEGTIKEKFEKPVSKNIKGSTVKRKATEQRPAYLIKQRGGNSVLKSETELKRKRKEK